MKTEIKIILCLILMILFLFMLTLGLNHLNVQLQTDKAEYCKSQGGYDRYTLGTIICTIDTIPYYIYGSEGEFYLEKII